MIFTVFCSCCPDLSAIRLCIYLQKAAKYVVKRSFFYLKVNVHLSRLAHADDILSRLCLTECFCRYNSCFELFPSVAALILSQPLILSTHNSLTARLLLISFCRETV